MKICKSCEYFKIVYQKCGYRFIYSTAYPHYYCEEKERMTEKESCCKNWHKKIAKCDISPKRLKEVEEDINFLINTLDK